MRQYQEIKPSNIKRENVQMLASFLHRANNSSNDYNEDNYMKLLLRWCNSDSNIKNIHETVPLYRIK